MEMTPTIIFGLLTIAVNVAMFLWSGAWGLSEKLGQMETRMLTKIEHNKNAHTQEVELLQSKIADSEKEMLERIFKLQSWVQESFVANGLFTETMRRFEHVLDRIDRKIDALQGRKGASDPQS